MSIAIVIGVVLVAASLPFTVAAFCKQEGCGEAPAQLKPFNISWSQASQASPAPAALDTAGAAGSGEASFEVNDALMAGVRIAFVDCTDTFDDRIGQQPASFNYTLSRSSGDGTSEVLAAGDFSCNGGSPDPASFPRETSLGDHPDVAQVQALNLTDAVHRAWNGTANETAVFTLRLVATRPPAQLGPQPLPGLPVAPTRMQAALTVEGMRWTVQATEHQEAPK